MIFGEGREVEVTSDEEGFRGVWFTATILKPPKNKTEDRALVQYKNLLEDDDKTLLTENVKLCFIRPLPPLPKVPDDQCFELNDVVDAFYHDGWWTGFVSEVFDDPKRYSVYFPDPPEEIEYSSSDLRPHWKWVDSKWVKPSKFQEVFVSSNYQARVELSCNTMKDAEAAIQLESSDAVKCSSKKHELGCVSSRKNEMGLSTASEGTVNGKRVKRARAKRDAALLHSSKKFKDGSLAGSLVIPESDMKVLPSETSKKEVPTAAIFPGKDVVGEQPVVKTRKVYARDEVEVLVSSDCHALVEHSCSTTKDAEAAIQLECSDAVKCSSKKHELGCVSSRKNEMGLSTASEGTVNGKRVKRARTKRDAALLHSSKKFKDGSLAGSLVLPESDMKVLPSETPKKEVPTAAIFPGNDVVGEQSVVKTRKVYARDEVDTDRPKAGGVREEKVGLLKECGRMLKSRVEGSQSPAADTMGNLKLAAVEVSEVDQITNEVESSVTRGLQIECTSGSGTEEACHVTKEEINLQKEHGMNRHQKEDGAKTGINRREQPHIVLKSKQPKLVIRISRSPSAEQNDASGVLEEMVSEECTATEVESSVISGLERAGSQTMSIESKALVSAKDCHREEIEVARKSGGIVHENEEQSPLICCKELKSGLRKIHSVVMEENNSGNIAHGFPNQWNNPREKSLEIIVRSPLVSMTGDTEREEGEDLPFVKSLSIWKAVESMDIFEVMPQNPHFHPLIKLKEIFREGLALGYMLTFASLVERTSKLTVADPRNHFTSILDALLDLEMLGFDVKAVRDRTNELLFMKDRHGDLQDRSTEFEVQVTQHSHELSKVNEEIDVIKKMVRELEEKQGKLTSVKESKISQIATLQVCSDVTTQDIQSVEYDFESLVGSPW